MHQAIDLAQGMDELGVNGIYFRVHHFARQQAAPMPLLAAIAARTRHIEMGTGAVDMRYENLLHLAEDAAAVDLTSGGRLALGVSRGSPETVVCGYEAFGYTGSEDPRGADIARDRFARFLQAIQGAGPPDKLVEQLKQDAAIRSADTLMLTIPSQLGVAFNLRLVEAFATHVAPHLGWEPTHG